MEAVPSKNQLPQSIIEDEEFWKCHAEFYKESGLTRKKYCRLHNVNYHRLGYWLGKFKQGQSSSLISVKLKSSDEASMQPTLCTLNLKGGHLLKIHDIQSLVVILEKYS